LAVAPVDLQSPHMREGRPKPSELPIQRPDKFDLVINL
jgi:hypothetical protein